MYNEIVMDHFSNPRNVGDIPDADGIGEVGNPSCGDIMAFYIKVKDDRLEDVKFKTFGCGAAIAVSSMVTEMAMGKTLDEAMLINPRSVIEALEGLPKKKHHCSNLGADALHKAIEDYRAKNNGTKVSPTEAIGRSCDCPVCEARGPQEEGSEAPSCRASSE
jgi:nitrogen fixation NifU-like protein